MTGFEPGEVLVISRSDVEEILTAKDTLQRCLEVFEWVGQGEIEQTNPVNLYVDDRSGPEGPFGHGIVQAFPALIRPLGRAAVKWLGGYRMNPKRNLPAISAIDLLTDASTGMPLAMIDGTSVTNMRTGGHAAVGAKYLARKDSSVLGVIGCGNEGRTHTLLLSELFPLEKIVVFDLAQSQIDEFRDQIEGKLGIRVEQAQSAEAAVADADIVCVVTTAPNPVVFERWIRQGTHVCAATGFRDVDKACARNFDKWVVGYYGRDLTWIEGDEVGRLGGLQPGDLVKEDIYADISTELMKGTKKGRETHEERTIMTHMGMPALDAGVASLVYDLAVESGRGTLVKVF